MPTIRSTILVLTPIILSLFMGCGTPPKDDLLAALDEPLSPTEHYDLLLEMATAIEQGNPEYVAAKEELGVRLRERLQDGRALVRSGAIMALHRIEGAAARRAILPMLHDKREFVRMDAARVLGEQEAEEAVPDLLVLLQKDASELVRLQAIRALTAIGVKMEDKSSMEGLVAALEQPSVGVRYQIALLLEDVSGQSGLGTDKDAWARWLAGSHP